MQISKQAAPRRRKEGRYPFISCVFPPTLGLTVCRISAAGNRVAGGGLHVKQQQSGSCSVFQTEVQWHDLSSLQSLPPGLNRSLLDSLNFLPQPPR
ncbi:hypothetical protein AAY473_004711 [Plecturocebus cupreus]